MSVIPDLDGDAIDPKVAECQKIDAPRMAARADLGGDLKCHAAQAYVNKFWITKFNPGIRLDGLASIARLSRICDADICLVDLVTAYLVRLFLAKSAGQQHQNKDYGE